MKSGWSIVVGFVLAAMVLGVCVACDDDDEESSFEQVVMTLPDAIKCAPFHCDPKPQAKKEKQGEDRSDGKNSRGKCENANYCDDKDFSPSFDESPVIICLPSSTCNF